MSLIAVDQWCRNILNGVLACFKYYRDTLIVGTMGVKLIVPYCCFRIYCLP